MPYEAIVHIAKTYNQERGECIAICETYARAERALDAFLDGLNRDQQDDILSTTIVYVEGN